MNFSPLNDCSAVEEHVVVGNGYTYECRYVEVAAEFYEFQQGSFGFVK